MCTAIPERASRSGQIQLADNLTEPFGTSGSALRRNIHSKCSSLFSLKYSAMFAVQNRNQQKNLAVFFSPIGMESNPVMPPLLSNANNLRA